MSASNATAPASGALVLRNLSTFSQLGSVQREALAILGDKAVDDIAKGYAAACALAQLKAALGDDKVMAPIMALQGNSVGFVTDRDKSGGYDLATVRDCVVTAFMLGLRLHGNEFNIISGRCYITVNGCDRVFGELCAEAPRHEPGIVEFRVEEKRALVDYKLTYRLKGEAEPVVHTQRVAVKLSFSPRDGSLLTTDDAVIGKARRKVLWSLLRAIRGIDFGADEGQVEKNVTPGGPVGGDRVAAKAAAGRAAFEAGPVVDAQPGETSTEGGAQ